MSTVFESQDRGRTAAAFADPQPGDMFSEMCSYWVIVLGRDGDVVTWCDDRSFEVGPHREIKAVRGVNFCTVEEFSRRFEYGDIPGWWVVFSRRIEKTAADLLELAKTTEGRVVPRA